MLWIDLAGSLRVHAGRQQRNQGAPQQRTPDRMTGTKDLGWHAEFLVVVEQEVPVTPSPEARKHRLGRFHGGDVCVTLPLQPPRTPRLAPTPADGNA
jgi:hypothetical protein